MKKEHNYEFKKHRVSMLSQLFFATLPNILDMSGYAKKLSNGWRTNCDQVYSQD